VPVEQVNQYIDQLRRQQLHELDGVDGGIGQRYYKEEKLASVYRGKDDRLLSSLLPEDVGLLGEF